MKRLITKFAENAIDTFKKVLTGENFPEGFWNGMHGKLNAIQIIKYLLTTKMKYSDEDIKNNLSEGTFSSNKLGDMLQTIFEGNPYLAIKAAFPNKFKPWEFKKFKGVTDWTDDLKKQAIKWLVEDQLHCKSATEIRKVKSTDFLNFGLADLFKNQFFSNTTKALSFAYPNLFIQEEQKMKEQKDSEEWKSVVEKPDKTKSKKQPRKDSRSSDVVVVQDPIKLYDALLKGIIFKFPNNYWQSPTAQQNAPELTRYMIDNVLKWNDEQITSQLSQKTFIDNKLKDMLDQIYNGDIYQAINHAYPHKFYPEDFTFEKTGNQKRLLKKSTS